MTRVKMPVRTEEDLGDETIVTNGGGKTIASGETTEQTKQGSKKSKVGDHLQYKGCTDHLTGW